MKQQEYIQDHYKILDLPSPCVGDQAVTLHDIKTAYRRALLQHHPDKSRLPAPTQQHFVSSSHTVDQITVAYKTLIDPKRRSEYDRLAKLKDPSVSLISEKFHPGLETVDLDDLAFDEEDSIWYRSCRCGNERGFQISEEELVEDAEHGEVITGCRGCSLWLRVAFAMVEDG